MLASRYVVWFDFGPSQMPVSVFDATEDDVLVLGGVHAGAKGISRPPELVREAKMCAIIGFFCHRFPYPLGLTPPIVCGFLVFDSPGPTLSKHDGPCVAIAPPRPNPSEKLFRKRAKVTHLPLPNLRVVAAAPFGWCQRGGAPRGAVLAAKGLHIMGTKDFLPTKDAELLAWSSNFSSLISSGAAGYGLLPAQATAYAALHSAFASALETATEPSTRTRGTVAAKDAARTPLKAEARELARIVNAFPSITNTQRINLGLNPRTGQVSPINPPTEAPVLEVVSANGRTLKVRLHAQGSDRRGKPANVAGATLFSYVGSAPPADVSAWKFEGSTSRTIFDVEFPPTVPAGAQVWLCCFWYSPRAQSGPACMPVCAYIAGGVAGALAA